MYHRIGELIFVDVAQFFEKIENDILKFPKLSKKSRC
jgi:hypothetical protein